MPEGLERKDVLIVVRTYPTPAKKSVEVSCTAGLTRDGKWIRLFPVPYRFLEENQHFHKYQWIEVLVHKATSDTRPESYKIVAESVRVLSPPITTADNWKARKDLILPHASHCLCCLKQVRDVHGAPTLGIFRPKTIHCLVIDEDESEWTAEQLSALRQQDLFGTTAKAELEKVPHQFRYEFQCDHESCTGHAMTCTDWEMGQAWRSWKQQYGSAWESKFRHRFEEEMLHKFDTHFIVGTIHGHPHTWIIIGLFYPPMVNNALPLFDGIKA